MPIGIYKHKPLSKETKEKLSLMFKGKKRKPFTKEHIQNLSISHIGNVNKNKGKKLPNITGEKHPFFGKKHKEISKLKMSFSAKINNRKMEKCPSWKGGISFEQYSIDWTETLRRSIRERDNYSCQLCGKQQGDKSHHVHHIDYNKKNCNPDNLITLCNKCHTKTNTNREYWVLYFEILNLIRNS